MLFRLEKEEVEALVRALDSLPMLMWFEHRDLRDWLKLILDDWERHEKNEQIWDSINTKSMRMST